MATASTVKLDAGLQPEFYVKGLGEESARVASELLQENHEKHHIFFNQGGFHVGILNIIFSRRLLTSLEESHRSPPPYSLRPQSLSGGNSTWLQ